MGKFPLLEIAAGVLLTVFIYWLTCVYEPRRVGYNPNSIDPKNYETDFSDRAKFRRNAGQSGPYDVQWPLEWRVEYAEQKGMPVPTR